MNRTIFGGIAVFSLSTSLAFASLIPINLVPTTGNGIGAVTTLLTFQNTGIESGCVGYAGGVTVTGPSVCLGGVVGPTHETTGSGNNTFTATALNIVPFGPGATNTFANLILLFNGNEGGGAAAGITIEKLSLNLLNGLTGTTLGSFTITAPYFATALPGVGNAPGVGFQLDAAQAFQANQLLLLNPSLRIGASATASGANAGFETVSISRISSVQGDPTSAIPEPSTFLMIGAGLIGVAFLKKRKING